MSGEICPTADSEGGTDALATVSLLGGAVVWGAGGGAVFLAVDVDRWWIPELFFGVEGEGFSEGVVEAVVGGEVDSEGAVVAVGGGVG
jgi:hypothetical protein